MNCHVSLKVSRTALNFLGVFFFWQSTRVYKWNGKMERSIQLIAMAEAERKTNGKVYFFFYIFHVL